MSSEEYNVVVPDRLLHRMANAEADFFWRVGRRDSIEIIKKSALGCRYPLTMLEKLLGKEKVKTLKILEIGSGYGFSLCYMLKLGLDIVGIEPGASTGFDGRYTRAVELLEANLIPDARTKLLDASAENLPFDDNTFDAVISVAVLEHVRDLDMSMREAIRVLKLGGLLWANVPNYNSTYEGHYDIFWIPRITKGVAKRYVKLFRRDPSFVDELNFTTPKMFKKYLNSEETHGRLYLCGRCWVNVIFFGYNCCLCSNLLSGLTESVGVLGKVVSLLQHSSIRRTLKIPLRVCTKVLEVLGLAAVFDLVLYKRGT